MSLPEVLVSVLPDNRMSKDEDDAHYQEQKDPRDSCHCLEEPECYVWLVVRGEMNFSCEASKIFM